MAQGEKGAEVTGYFVVVRAVASNVAHGRGRPCIGTSRPTSSFSFCTALKKLR
jgi:hypothetical protein